jgi:uncharacterized protein (TIGR02569 family)
VLKVARGTCHGWLGQALADLEPKDVRIAKPVPARTGAWWHEGWGASAWVGGTAPDPREPGVWRDVVEAGRAFHRAVAHLARPDCLQERRDPWAVADSGAWGERSLQLPAALEQVAQRLQCAQAPLGRPQLVHGDLTGNVLFAAGLPPAIIDLSPYWRPPAYADGIVVADALCWHGATPSLLTEIGVPESAVARGLLFRMLTTSERVLRGEVAAADIVEEAHRYEEAASAIGL